MTENGGRIGDAAATLAVATHILRHWEDVGLLRPRRLSSGHRTYDDQTIGQARMIQICQRAGRSPKSKNSASATAGTRPHR